MACTPEMIADDFTERFLQVVKEPIPGVWAAFQEIRSNQEKMEALDGQTLDSVVQFKELAFRNACLCLRLALAGSIHEDQMIASGGK